MKVHPLIARFTPLVAAALIAFAALGREAAGGVDPPVQTAPWGSLEPITPIPRPPPPDARSRLGATLFGDVRLSHDGLRTCATCHDIRTNGADATPVDLASGGHPLRHNTLTVFNAALEFRQNWTGEFGTLEEQADASIRNPALMGGRWEEILARLRADRGLTVRFVEAYGRPPDQETVIGAISAFERTLLTPDSRFDRWLRGEATALSGQELEGYRLFKAIGCSSCHQGVSVGANLYERDDVFSPLFKDHAERMRVASLRNVAVTAPYFDDGSSATLDQAVDRMAVAQLGSRLQPDQRAAIVAFLGSLTGTFAGRPLTAPAARP